MTTPWPADAWYLQLADLTIDLRFRRLIHSGQSVELPQRVFDLWLLFLGEPNRLHTRTELFDRLWAGTIVEDTNLSQNVWLLRKALGEKRKGWIRTVAKSGYVFEPPGPLQWFKELPQAPQPGAAAIAPRDSKAFVEAAERSASFESRQAVVAERSVETGAITGRMFDPAPLSTAVETGPAPIPAAGPASVRSARSGKRVWVFAALASIVAAVAVILSVQHWSGFGASEPKLAVALVTIEDQQTTTRWPAKLLEEWLSWKLGSLPEVNLLSESDLAAGQGAAAAQVVFLSSVRVANDPNKLALHVRFQNDGEERHIAVTGEPAEMPALVDAVSRQVMSHLLQVPEAPWPALELSAKAAQRYEQAAQALDRRDWMAATAIGSEVVEAAPRFGLMRLQLAQAQARLAQGAAASAQMEAALELLRPAPAEAVALLQAQALALDPRRSQDALKAFASLADRYPDNVAYRLEHARLSIDAGKPQEALARLADGAGDRHAIAVRVAQHLLRAEAYGKLGDPARMRTQAGAAERLARQAGPGWTLETADALLLKARADSNQFPERPVPLAYEQSAQLYEQGGNSTGALRARVLARTAGPLTGDADPALDVLLARANAGGYHRLEIDVLVASADQYMKAGDADSYRARLMQAAAIANASGDWVSMARLDVRLLYNDLLTLRLDSAAVRSARLRELQLQGNQRLLSNQLAGGLATMRGHAAEALEISRETERLLPALSAGQEGSEAHAQLGCARTDYLLALGRLAEVRKELDRCSQGDRQTLRSLVLLGRSQVALLGGDSVQAVGLLEQAEASMPNAAPDSWNQGLEVARLATVLGRTEKSERIYSQLLPPLQRSGYTLFVAQAITGLAENAAARGDWVRSRIHAANVRKLIPGDAWFLIARLDLLAVADARQHGDRATAVAMASKLHQRARQLGDVIVEMHVHRILEPGAFHNDCSAAEREALVARTGMRGIDVDWLVPAGEAARSASP
ncbi:winged helix-turn-helix domain-containing protein [Lysobacter antibioticus]|uniref:Transcriptional regulatory, C terminal family protein n=1 Tax=Lysobacter antibioticus TaxID=84531 RepID=A0A0S2FBU2_LYSAN|nr:winged helix-turn-helix domain-containing protein [Lysobacter antibioticus]ALN81009.1 transcriptional regulatory, C terminal family protein [Lysobacter antibioticus]